MRVVRLFAALVMVPATAIAVAVPQSTPIGLATAVVHPLALRSVFMGPGAPPTTADCEKHGGIACYAPFQLQRAYDLEPLYALGLDGTGRTIAIVDSFGSPTIKRDLHAFDVAFGLPEPPSFQIIQPAGRVPPFDKHNALMQGWAGETSLDVEWAHAMAPGANILLVETPVAETLGVHGFKEIVEAENYVIDRGLADVISQSFGATEPTFPSEGALLRLRSAFENAMTAGVTVLASSGDSGSAGQSDMHGGFYPLPAVIWPASDPLVTAVGGTHLQLDSDGNRTAPDEVWNESFDKTIVGKHPSPVAAGGGVSMFFDRPSFQDGVAATTGLRRAIPDVSLTAAIDGGAIVFQSVPGSPAGFYVVGGTSLASPLFAGIVAIAAQKAGHSLGYINPILYGPPAAAGIVDVTVGDNGAAFENKKGKLVNVPGYDAVTGFDLATGLGTVDAALLVNALAP